MATAERSRPAVVLARLVALTKPRIISLLLVTTIAPMFVAGQPSWLLVLHAVVGGTSWPAARTRSTCTSTATSTTSWRARACARSRAAMRRAQVLAFGVVARRRRRSWLLAHFVERADRGARARGDLLLRLRLHALAQAQHAAEHRDRRRGRRVSAARRLGGGHGTLDLLALFLFLIIFYWTPPHFWALALLIKRRLRPRAACRWRRSSPRRARPRGRSSRTPSCWPSRPGSRRARPLGPLYAVAAAVLGRASCSSPSGSCAPVPRGGARDVPLLARLPRPPVRGHRADLVVAHVAAR